ncbi:hypothetical protein C7974DRAFT_136189 [Boeremia exigua]|uniref:uncharacterized protein n=1 Tax=Boeremia exigua TaxID=749465 RepID=UPI001E8D934F|nr:uncharacterized protein C7974DRAFT_136189 [Boeremia exigua]KAH6639649.1 hypothetical protein C7974DRAFT_136189 [Boeremia exigua]
MAIVPGCLGLVVEISVNGVPLQEYNNAEDEEETPGTVTKYIEAQSGANFVVGRTVTTGLPAPQFRQQVWLDGKLVHTMACRSVTLGEMQHNEGRISAIGGQTVCQKYQFSEMNIVEGSIDRIDKTLLEEIASTGLITVTFHSICNIRSKTSGSTKNPMTVASFDSVPEKALKGQAKSHQASLSEPEVANPIGWSSCDLASETPFATFQFKYRSRAALQTLHILPRTPTPVPLEERPEEDLSTEELCQLVKRFKERDATALRIKKEDNAKRKRSGEDTDDFEIVDIRNKRRHHHDPNEIIVLD